MAKNGTQRRAHGCGVLTTWSVSAHGVLPTVDLCPSVTGRGDVRLGASPTGRRPEHTPLEIDMWPRRDATNRAWGLASPRFPRLSTCPARGHTGSVS